MLTLSRTTSSDENFTILVSQLEIELQKRYGAIQDLYNTFNKVCDLPTVIVAYANDIPAGCGCFKKYNNKKAEIKRMYVDIHERGKGIGKAILLELEKWAIESGYTGAILETGLKQPESIRLYESCGYYKIPNYEPYMDMVESICFEKVF
jgi:putative acetyltransferase